MPTTRICSEAQAGKSSRDSRPTRRGWVRRGPGWSGSGFGDARRERATAYGLTSRTVYEVMHSGAWLPVSAWGDSGAWKQLIDWIIKNCPDSGGRLIITPTLADRLNSPDGLRRVAKGAAHVDAGGNGPGRVWGAGDGPIVVVWPEERTVQNCVRTVAGLPRQSIILLEQAVPGAQSFRGWASAVGAFNAQTGEHEHSYPDLDEQLEAIFTNYENELALAPTSRGYPNSAPALREKLQAVHAGGYDEDFIVTYAIALGYQGDLGRLRRHYSAARQD
jgi:hypothetical protein